MKAKEYPLLCRAVEEGLEAGWRRYWKHRPGESAALHDQMLPELEEAVINELLEAFDIDSPESDPEKFDAR